MTTKLQELAGEIALILVAMISSESMPILAVDRIWLRQSHATFLSQKWRTPYAAIRPRNHFRQLPRIPLDDLGRPESFLAPIFPPPEVNIGLTELYEFRLQFHADIIQPVPHGVQGSQGNAAEGI